eukprot:COSAG05_NODE_1312_length_5217_cov_2.233685_2_plen_69_part_00
MPSSASGMRHGLGYTAGTCALVGTRDCKLARGRWLQQSTASTRGTRNGQSTPSRNVMAVSDRQAIVRS